MKNQERDKTNGKEKKTQEKIILDYEQKKKKR